MPLEEESSFSPFHLFPKEWLQETPPIHGSGDWMNHATDFLDGGEDIDMCKGKIDPHTGLEMLWPPP